MAVTWYATAAIFLAQYLVVNPLVLQQYIFEIVAFLTKNIRYDIIILYLTVR